MCGILFSTLPKNPKIPFNLIKYRGPDNTTLQKIDKLWFGHHRLNIIEINNDQITGNQPIIIDNIVLICNGEIYNYKQFETENNKFSSDCSAIITLYLQNKLTELNGDFAFVLYDISKNKIVVGRDPAGLKPLFYYYDDVSLIVSSEIKVISAILEDNKKPVENIYSVPINSYSEYVINRSNNVVSCQTKDISDVFDVNNHVINTMASHTIPVFEIAELLENSIRRRLEHTNKPVALLCSGGLDSSIICALVYKLLKNDLKNLHIFTIAYDNGISYDEFYSEMLINNLRETSGFDIKYTKVSFNKDATKYIPDIINYLETYDPNTIRAAIPMYLLAKYIRENTDYKVILSGEASDELFMGYNYFTIKNPTPIEASEESVRLVKNLHCFDVLRAERCFSVNGLELRCPFLDKDLVKYVLNIDPVLRNTKVEKLLLRNAFVDLFKELGISDKILNREKERLSDGCGYNWVADLINFTNNNECKPSNKDGSKIETHGRLENEKLFYKQIYDQKFKTSFKTNNGISHILPRELPIWAENEISKPLLISNETSFNETKVSFSSSLDDTEKPLLQFKTNSGISHKEFEIPQFSWNSSKNSNRDWSISNNNIDTRPIPISNQKYSLANPPPIPDFLKSFDTRKVVAKIIEKPEPIPINDDSLETSLETSLDNF